MCDRQANQAAMQYGWDGLILGYAAKVGRGGSTGRIAYASPQNELYTVDDRGTFRSNPNLDPEGRESAESALRVIRERICPGMRDIVYEPP